MSPRPRRPPLAVVALGVVLVVLAGLAVYAVVRTGDGGERPSGAASASPTPLSQVDLGDRRVPRRPFCSRLEQRAVTRALGGPVSQTAHYTTGERVTLAPGVRDVSHEFDCTFVGADDTEARVWVFAEPVTRERARALVREARAVRGCRVVEGGPRLGTPGVTTACRVRPGRSVTASGLFGDAWVTCQLTDPTGGAAPVTRARRWCVDAVSRIGRTTG